MVLWVYKKLLNMPHNINYNIKESKRARGLRIVVNCDAGVSVVTPKGFDKTLVDDFISQKSCWIKEKIEHFESRKKIELPKDVVQGSYHTCNARAKRMIKGRVEHFNSFYNFKYNRISIKKQSTRWGSCSSKRNLNFNYKLLFLSQELADYVVVHELCHLEEMNHSKKFWDLVGKSFPNFKEIRKEMRGISL